MLDTRLLHLGSSSIEGHFVGINARCAKIDELT